MTFDHCSQLSLIDMIYTSHVPGRKPKLIIMSPDRIVKVSDLIISIFFLITIIVVCTSIKLD